MSSLVNTAPPLSEANISSIFGMEYVSNFDALLTVNLKSPHIRIFLLSLFKTGTIDATHSAN